MALGETIEPERHFFDGLISPVAGMTQLFNDGFPLFAREDIAPGPGHPTWMPYGIRFLHHFRAEPGGLADIDRYFDQDLSRFTHLRQKFHRLRERRRVVFVISNSQNNLTDVARETLIATLHYKQSELEELQSAVDAFLARPCEYLVVSHPDRHGGVALPNLTILEADDSEWTGDKKQWRALFNRYLQTDGVEPFSV